MDIRRVVTGHDAGGKAVIVSNESVLPITAVFVPGVEWRVRWGAEPVH
jgi:hypothetical protein